MNDVLRLARRVTNALGIGRQTADTVETEGTATMQMALPGGELRSDVPHLQLFGFTSRPLAGGDVLVVFQNGDRSRGVVVASGDQRTRPRDLAPGEVCIWHPTGSRVWLKADGSIAIQPANGKTVVTGTLTADEVIAGGVHLSTHKHTNGNQGGNTGAPIAG